MKQKLFALLLCVLMLVPVLAMAETEITLWTYPIGNWTNAETVDAIIAGARTGKTNALI